MEKIYCEVYVRNGKFCGDNGVNVRYRTEREVQAQGWNMYVEDTGRISCVAIQNDKEGKRHVLKLVLKENNVRFTHKVGNDRPQTIREYENCNGWPLNGTIYVNGTVNPAKNKAFFRSLEFEEFLKQHGITSVVHKEPNFWLEIYNSKTAEDYFNQKLYTDGAMLLIEGDSEEQLLKKKCTEEYEAYQLFLIKGATWLIKETETENCVHRVLHTIMNPQKISNLPLIEEMSCFCNKCYDERG